MCGRFTLQTPVLDWLQCIFPSYADQWPALVAGLIKTHPSLCEARYNIAPTQSILCITQHTCGITPELVPMRWGLVPGWADSLRVAYTMINARSDSLTSKPTFRPLLDRYRCVVLADGYYEWRTELLRSGKELKQPFWIHRKDHHPFAIGGLWTQNNKIPDGPIQSATFITTDANKDLEGVHDRMPVLFNNEQEISAWLSADATWDQISSMAVPAPSGTVEAIPVSTRVNSVKNQGPELLQGEIQRELF